MKISILDKFNSLKNMKKQLVLRDNEYSKFAEFIRDCQTRGFIGINNYDRHIYHVREQFIRWHINEIANRVVGKKKRHLTLSQPEILSINIMRQRIEHCESIRPLIFKIIKMDKIGLHKSY